MRLMGQWLSERLGQQFIIENRTGAGTNIATEAVVRAVADGFTLLMSSAANAINATLYDRLLQFHPRHHANRWHHARAARDRRAPIVLDQDSSRVDRLCQSQSGQAHLGFARHWNGRPCLRIIIQDDGWSQHDSRAVARRRSRDGRPAQRSATSIHRRYDLVA
jgi:Tripartite tricarboxylate transporter family receptor